MDMLGGYRHMFYLLDFRRRKMKAPEISPECKRILRTLKKKEEEKLNK
jgi:hypothetical protein